MWRNAFRKLSGRDAFCHVVVVQQLNSATIMRTYPEHCATSCQVLCSAARRIRDHHQKTGHEIICSSHKFLTLVFVENSGYTFIYK